jgi:hypothetical protein
MFGIDFDHLVKSTLPADKKTSFNVKLHIWWLLFASRMHDSAAKFGELQFQRATTTAQIGSLVQTLNDLFDPSVSIYIEDVEWIDDVYVYLDLEPYQEVAIYTDGENVAPEDEVYIYSDAEVNPIQYIIYVPGELFFPAFLEQIRAQADQHGLAGKYYTIQIIP